MAKQESVWGIDLGQCAFKALRCRLSEDKQSLVVDAFEYHEYPKPLRQAEPEETEQMIQEALERFLERNEVQGHRVVVGVSGQMGLTRFIKLPPVELERVPDIVRFEARQQIPFDLSEVIWDYQRMAGGRIDEGFVMETEVGLFAMKRDQVYRCLEPFDQAGIEVDVIQLSPLAVFNFAAYDILPQMDESEYDPENPPPSIMLLSFGTDNSDLVITDGFHVWQRPIPIGGNHFTKAITKEFKQTFAKAEHIKRNASHFENPKALFQAMRPVFTDLATEIQRSLNYFSNINKAARIKQGIALGNAAKLPGLMRFLSQNLQLPVDRLERFNRLQGAQVIDSPAFKENMLSMVVSYGLCVQGLGVGRLDTNLMPPEILQERLIRAKKPWTVAAAAALLLGFGIHLTSQALALYTVDEKKFSGAESQASAFVSQVNQFRSQYDEARREFENIDKIGKHLIQTTQRQKLWLELLAAIDACLPREEPGKLIEHPWEEKQLHITEISAQEVEVSQWLTKVRRWLPEQMKERLPEPARTSSQGTQGASGGGGAGAQAGGGNSSGGNYHQLFGLPQYAWLVRIKGFHYHNKTRGEEGHLYVKKTLLENLQKPCCPSPHDPNRMVPVRDLGICCPIMVNIGKIDTNHEIPNPDYDPMNPDKNIPPTIRVPRFDFEVQFLWCQDGPPQKQSSEAASVATPGSATGGFGGTGSATGGASSSGTIGAR